MAEMTEDELGQQIEDAVEEVLSRRAMNPSHASQQNSVDFLDGVISELQTNRTMIKMEMEG